MAAAEVHDGDVRRKVECKGEGGEKERPGDEWEEACWDERTERRERSVEGLEKKGVSEQGMRG